MQPTAATVTSMVLTSSTLPQSPAQSAVLPTAHDSEQVQSMDWLFKKERIYLLAQFWQQRATLAEKEISSLKEQLNNNTLPKMNNNNDEDHDIKTDTNDAKSIDNEILHKDTEINRLMEEVQRLQKSLTKIQETSLAQIACLEQQLEHRNSQIMHMEARLEVQRDYDEIRRELMLLKSKTNNESKEESVENQISDADSDEDIDKEDNDGSDDQEVQLDKEKINEENDQRTNSMINSGHVQNVDSFGSMLGEEIVANWRKNIERSILSRRSPEKDSSIDGADKSTASTPVPGSDIPTLGEMQKRLSPMSSSEEMSLAALQQQQQAAMCAAALFRNAATAAAAAAAAADEQTFTSSSLDMHHQRIGGPYRFVDDLGSMVNRLGESLIPKGDPMEARLQEMLRFNMDKYASQNLDTLHISRKVRELLSIHNIGQRLFAKYVLGLSQGTVSELLSKPKPWDKLTEKGRDSYRKMHAWAYDDNAVMLLKSLIPKKGKEPSVLPFSGGSNSGTSAKIESSESMSDERIAHFLGETNSHVLLKSSTTTTPSSVVHADDMSPQNLINNNNNNNGPDDNDTVLNFGSDRISPLSMLSKRLKKYDNDDISQDKVMRIYHEELSKLMNRKFDDFRLPRDHIPGLFFPPFLPMDKNQDEFRLALESYNRELAKMNPVPNLANLIAIQQQHQQQAALMLHHQQQQQAAAAAAVAAAAAHNRSEVQDLSIPKESLLRPSNSSKCNGFDDSKDNTSESDLNKSQSVFNFSTRPSNVSNSIGGNATTTCSSTASSPLGNAILPPEDFQLSANMTSTTVSPLQRMASITNSLISQPTTSTHPSPSQRPLKAVLPPITQQQFDLYNNLNTEEIVKKVKENLSQYSISQRLFGESVLGLSQGSVSDLLARPKPWHMLTQKGREPFIRMKMFLEDENAVHKLVASQYKIAPEKLMRTGGYATSGSLCPQSSAVLASNKGNSSQIQSSKLLSESVSLLNKFKQEQIGSAGSGNSSNSITQNIATAFHAHAPTSQTLNFEAFKKLSQSSTNDSLLRSSSNSNFGSSLTSASQHHMTSSVYEMAALTQDLDTQMITTKIKEALLANNIGQKIFGEAVLGLSQGSVSELLSKPKPWHMLSIKGREPFIRMQLWLNDTHNIDRLQALKNERREATKRRRSFGCIGSSSLSNLGASNANAQDNSSDTSSNDTSDFYNTNSPSGCSLTPTTKKQRVLFSDEQKEALKLAFTLDSYPNVSTVEFLANELNLSSRTITNWFHNHRMRLKQQAFDAGINRPNESSVSMSVPPPTTFDPSNFRLLLNQRLLDISKDRLNISSTGPITVNSMLPSYLQSNPSFALLLSRGLLSSDMDFALLNNSMKEQMRGLDLSIKRELDDCDEFDDDNDDDFDNISRFGQSDNESQISNNDEDTKPQLQQSQRSRRKPVAPQWVNPDWQDENCKKTTDEMIINGVCVMKQDNSSPRNDNDTDCVIMDQNIPITDVATATESNDEKRPMK